VFANGDYHYAAFLIAEAVRLDPAIVTAEVDKRDFYGERKTFDNQMDALQKYCTDKPYDAWAQLVLGYNMRFSDRPTRAVAAFRRVLELDRDNPTARAFLADLVPALRTDDEGKKDKKSAPAEGAAKPGEAAKIK
jgi:tetratricopeptide (TPR) repeat protein